MMIRTIQHPGIQIQETEIKGTKGIVVSNNAYIMGFADKGPIYDYSFITSLSDFNKIYGEPKTEAEKYLFIAAQSVLANGGTPIVARIPYDNKQCKTYKGLSITWDADAVEELKDDKKSETYDFSKVINEKIKKAKDVLTGYCVPLSTNVGTIIQAAIPNVKFYGEGSSWTSGKIELDTKDYHNLYAALSSVVPSSKLTGKVYLKDWRSSSAKLKSAMSKPSSIIYYDVTSACFISGDYYNSNISSEFNLSSNSILTGNKDLSGNLSKLGFDSLESTIYDDDHILTESFEEAVKIANLSGDYKEVSGIVSALLDIYTHPILVQNLSAYAKTNETIDKEILKTNEMGFKNILTFNTEDVLISNDQYDDLVSVNKFSTDGESKYGCSDLATKNFVIIDKNRSVVQGDDGQIGYFTAIVDPYDALKVQKTLVNPYENALSNIATKDGLSMAAALSKSAWSDKYEEVMNSMDCLGNVRSADNQLLGNPDTNLNKTTYKVWSTPLSGAYADDSISKTIMKGFKRIPMADIDSNNINKAASIIDHTYSTYICVNVCKTAIDPSNGKLTVNIIESWFGSLLDETNPQTGASMYIGDIINANSDYIEFYKNNDTSPAIGGSNSGKVDQIFIENSEPLRKALEMRGIDPSDYEGDEDKLKDRMKTMRIYTISKSNTCIYNVKTESLFTSYSKKDSQKVIANTTGLYSEKDMVTENIANNLITDMDRCIKFIKNRDDVAIHFVVDAGLSTIANFCDNIFWDKNRKSSSGNTVGGWVTQPFDPDNDPDDEDKNIDGFEAITTWRKVVNKIISIAGDIRKDCFAIVDAPRQLTLDGAAKKIRRSKFDNNFDKTIGKALRYITGFNSSYAAGYYNWLRANDPVSGRPMWVPPTAKIIGNYCYLNIMNLPWLAPAGLNYGAIAGCYDVSHNPDPDEEDQIYTKSWNYIKQYPLEGLVVEGQRTMLGSESVFERINVRLLFLDLERYAYNVSRTFKYEVNNSYTREQFVATLKPKFDDYMVRGGIYEFLIKVDSSNNTPETIDANELRGDIYIKPGRLIEFVLLNFVGTATSTDFTELALE